MIIILPWPPASLSGHANGHWRTKAAITKRYRMEAWVLTLAAGRREMPEGDIPIRFTFEPPNRRGDRTNMPARLKPLIDGIADALSINDSRFLPEYVFGEPYPGGRVIAEIALKGKPAENGQVTT